jgi:hypothetical protein
MRCADPNEHVSSDHQGIAIRKPEKMKAMPTTLTPNLLAEPARGI